MKSRRLLTWLRPSALVMVLSFAIGALIISQPLLTPPAAAKGAVNSRANDNDSNKSTDQPKQEEKKPDPPKVEPPKPEPPKPDPPRYEQPKQEPQPAPQPQPRYEQPAPPPPPQPKQEARIDPQPEPPKQVVQPAPPPVTQPSQPVVAQPSPAPQPQYPTPAPQPTEERRGSKSGMRNAAEEQRNDSSTDVSQPNTGTVHDITITPSPKPDERRRTDPPQPTQPNKPERKTVESTSERRGSGPGTIGDKIEDRRERRDRNDRGHRHRDDWYDPPTIVIYEPVPVPVPVPVPMPEPSPEPTPIPPMVPTPGQEPPSIDHQGDPRPEPGSIDEALQDIQAAWLEKDPEFLGWHVDRGDTVDIYIDHKFSHTLKAEEFLSLTRDAIDSMKTYEFRYIKTRKSDLSARAMAEHIYRDLDQGVDKSIRLTYFLEKIRGKWLIKRIDVQKGETYGSPDAAQPAGSAVTMTKEVLIMRRFRDPDLLAKKPGALFVTEYRRADPSVLDAAASDSTVVATIVRPASDQAFKADLPSEDNW